MRELDLKVKRWMNEEGYEKEESKRHKKKDATDLESKRRRDCLLEGSTMALRARWLPSVRDLCKVVARRLEEALAFLVRIMPSCYIPNSSNCINSF